LSASSFVSPPGRSGGPAWSTAANVLCVRLDTLGDVVMTGPALRALRHAAPGRRLTLLTSSAGAAAAPLLPDVDELLTYDAPWLKASAKREDASPDHEMIEALAGRGFDAAVIFTVYSQSPLPAAFMCHLAGVPLRLAHCRENPYLLLTDWLEESEPQAGVRHEVRRQLDLVASVGVAAADERLRLEVPRAARDRVRELLRGMELGGRWAVLHPGASAPSRRYPAESWVEAATRLVRDHGCGVVFSGDRSEQELVDSIRAGMGAPSRSLAGELGAVDLAALLAEAPVLVAGNTGPVHLAAGVGTPVVDLYALTNPQHTPWGVPSRVLARDVPCRWCYKSVCPEGHHHCLRLVEPGEVVAAALELLGPEPPRRAV
jgi:lipopolysaccharide heptosyltransferase II